MVEINLKNIHKRYDGAKSNSVTDFNLDIADRDFIVFVGPSGCGKSTTLRMIAGLEEISSGQLYIDGQLMNDVAPKDRDIAMVFQNYALYPHMTVYDNMAFGLKLRQYKKDQIDEKVRHAAELLGLTDYLDRKPSALSGGQRQRVALGRAIVRDAKVFLMDEPLSNLDAKLRVQMRAEIAKLHQRLQTTTIYVTHDQTEAMTMASRIVIMKDGLIQQIGTPQEVYTQPANVFVASFIGSPAMNFFHVTVEENYLVNDWGLKLLLTAHQQQLLTEKGFQGKPIILGIRPEDIKECSTLGDTPPQTIIEATITVAELLGAESMLYLTYANEEFIARIAANHPHDPNDKISLAFDMDKAHFFDPESEIAIR